MSKLQTAAVVAALFTGTAMLDAADAIKILPAPQPTSPGTPIAWVKAGDDSWRNGAPTFQMSNAAGLKAIGYLATTDTELLLRLDVTDSLHINTQTGSDIWNGDFIGVGIDARGDGPGNAPASTPGLFGPDDAQIGFALTPTGPQGWTFNTLVKEMEGAYPKDLLNFSRDEAKHLTRYDIRIPWSHLATKPGVFPQFGIGVHVRNIDTPTQTTPTEIRWGGSASGYACGMFQKVTFPTPVGSVADIVPLKTEVWDSHDTAEIYVAYRGTQPATLRVSGGDAQQSETLAANDIARRIIRYTPAGDAASAKLTVAITPTNGDATSRAVDLTLAEPTVRELVSRLQDLATSSTNPLFTRHLRSVEALVQTEWAKATTYKCENASLARETLGYIAAIRDGFATGMPGKLDSYMREGMPLLMAFRSQRDNTLQYYTLTLPKAYDPAKPSNEQALFPLYLELHGAGNPHPLNGPSALYGNTKTGALGYESPGTYAMHQRAGYHIMPFGRGNSGYRDIGETDVWEALADFEQSFKADPDRQYLYGFSMGGGGTWSIGRQTPDRWAAIAILGMGARASDYQARNVSIVPVYMWGGETDAIAFRGGKPKDIIDAFAKAVKAAGGDVHASTTPNIGHNYLGEIQKDSIEWLSTHTRHRPSKFSFTVDDDRHPGIWGITLRRDVAISGLPSFDCQIDGQTVHIKTQGTPEVRIIAGDHGLQMAGDITVFVNNKQTYQGPATNEPITAKAN